MNERRKTFGVDPGPTDDLGASDFQPRPIARPDPAAARRVAEADGYTSGATTRAPGDTQHRYRTGRTAQLNLKVTPETRARFAAMADAAGVSMNELFERAFAAYLKSEDGR
ncbi:MAG: stability/partitioning determinant [Brevundimonas sp.]|uniref:ribbon-helix-helix protein, CopG family n=1 Tax=Brevundimonas sp. TaxID=1871086 RepID=UPI000DB3810C|nr:ribbon-helix-helix protein, CopG family [Brevundimonas sp.]PZU74124.1 MAG: stability/partitioning determinant [Brevundimonas sp.]